MNDEISKRCLSTDDIYDIIDGEATEELVSYFEEHIKSCEKCRSEYENVKKLKAALRDYTSAPSADFTKNTLARMKTVERNPFIRITGSKAFKTKECHYPCYATSYGDKTQSRYPPHCRHPERGLFLSLL
jgi:hypothetical protein